MPHDDGSSQDEALYKRQADAFSKLGSLLDKDLLLFRHSVQRETADSLLETVYARTERRKNVGLIVSTLGGIPDDAFRIARCLQEAYTHVTMYVFGECKSAGTLIVLGGHDLVMSEWGELGPMDIQILREDQMFFRASGIDTEEAFERIRDQAVTTFKRFLTETLNYGAGRITLKTAADVAVKMTVGLFTPITRQISPQNLGETARSMRILQEYAVRLSRLRTEQTVHAVAKLSSAYPSHSFVIDRKESESLFGKEFVRKPNELEQTLSILLGDVARYAPYAATDGSYFGAQIRYLDRPVHGTGIVIDPAQLPLFSDLDTPDPNEQADGRSQKEGRRASSAERGRNGAPARSREVPDGPS